MSVSIKEERAPSESSALLRNVDNNHRHRALRFVSLLVGAVMISILVMFAGSFMFWRNHYLQRQRESVLGSSLAPTNFPADFVWGAGTSSFQIEGATHEDGRGLTVWDTFVASQPSPNLDHSNADIACDHYHRLAEDVALMKDLNLTAYRFSIAWSRILPQGTRQGGVNQAGIDFYNHLIDTLIENDIVPFVTLFHWDTPHALELFCTHPRVSALI